MPKLILRCNYLKNAPPSHLENYVTYIGTRDGVEKSDNTTAHLPSTAGQKELIQDILKRIPDTKKMHEYYDYLQRPTRENASEFITQALENNLDIIAKKKNYMDYLANRPGVEKTGTHGLFSNEGESIVLSRVAEDVANHTGVVWTNVISLRREDAERLGYNSAAQWQALLRSRVDLLCENYRIDSRNLKWYAAFHNESHHPHVHLVVYSSNPSEGYLTKKGIDAMRSAYAHDIFRQEFMSIYERKTEQRERLKEQADKSLLFQLRQMQQGVCHNEKIAEQMQILSKRLGNTGGKKVYGYLKADVKAIVNSIVDELAKEEPVAACYRAWLESKNEILHYYKDTLPEPPPLSSQKELKSIKNMVIREAVRFGEGCLYSEEEGLSELEERCEESVWLTELQETEAENDESRSGIPETYADHISAGYSDEDISEMREAGAENDEDIQDSRNTDSSEKNESGYYAEWTDTYKEAGGYLYGTEEAEPDLEAAYEVMKEEAERGNAYAMYDMGKIYAQGIFVEPDQEKAAEWYGRALSAMLLSAQRKGNACLEYRIGKMYQYGFGTEANLAEAAEWFLSASEKEHKNALYSLGMLCLHGKGVEQDESKACQLFLRSHKQDNPYAAYELGKMYETGKGTEKNIMLAKNFYHAAFLGFLKLEKKSCDDTLWYRIGSMYLHGIGTEVNEAHAEKYLLQSADYGNTHAAYQLAKLYIRQETERRQREPDSTPDYNKIRKALEWLGEAATQGNPFVDYTLGKLYGNGVLTAREMDKVFFHLHRAADAGNVHSQYQLGVWYLTEEYKDIPKAVCYLTLAADQKNEFAAYRLGKLYLSGVEVPKNVVLAIQYLEASACAGNQYAQYTLGKLYFAGKDVEQDKEKAYKYFMSAAEQGNVYAAYFLEHWNDMPHLDLFLMASRLMHQLGHIIEEDISGRKRGGNRAGVDRKLARRMKEKKVAQGHAEDDKEMVQTQ